LTFDSQETVQSNQANDGESVGARRERESRGRVQLVTLSYMTVILLLIMFLFGALAVVIGTRRWRAMAEHKRAAPTPNADVWAMHKVPEDYLDD